MTPTLPRLATLCSALVLAGCAATTPTAGSSDARTAVRGAAAGSSTHNAGNQLERCDKPLGSIALLEDTTQPWYERLRSDVRVEGVTPLLRLMIQQSGCFLVVERGKGLHTMETERALARSGELRKGSKVGKGQMVAADFTASPSITFSARGTAGVGAAIGGRLFGSVGAAIGGSLQQNQASVTLLLTDNRSGVQVAAAEGSAENWDMGAVGGFLGGGAGVVGGYSKTPQGKVLVAAFLDSYNQMVRALRDYRPQQMDGAIGRGGKLNSN